MTNRVERIGAATTLIALSLVSGCKLTPHTSIAPSSPLGQESSSTFRQFADVLQFYPELKDILPLQHGTIDTDITHLEWFNFSHLRFDDNKARSFLAFFMSMANSGIEIEYDWPEGSAKFSLAPRLNTSRTIFVVDEGTPRPFWAPGNSFGLTTATYDNDVVKSLIVIPAIDDPRSKLFDTRSEYATNIFATEMCQSHLEIHSDTAEHANVGQEVICNSLGDAVTASALGMPYSRYVNTSRDIRFGQSGGPIYKPTIVPLELYDIMPKSGNLFS